MKRVYEFIHRLVIAYRNHYADCRPVGKRGA